MHTRTSHPSFDLTDGVRSIGSGLEARTRSHGRERKAFYGCASYHRRGRCICDNGLVVPIEIADDAVLGSLETDLLNPHVIDAAVRRALSVLTSVDTTDVRDTLRRELGTVEQEIANLTVAIAAGGNLRTLVSALQTRENRRRELLDQLNRTMPADSLNPESVLADLQGRLSSWRSLLRDNISRARGLLKQLIVGRLEMTPDRESSLYRFKGTGTLAPIFAGICLPQIVASPTGVRLS